jgi:hypothetical protein
MSSGNDVPLGEAARRYYEVKFADRIRQVRKFSDPTGRIGGEKWEDVKAVGLFVSLFFLIGIGIFLTRGRNNSTEPPNSRPNTQTQMKDGEVRHPTNRGGT